MTRGDDVSAEALRRRVAELEPWFHNLYLPNGVQTAPDHPLGDFPRFKWLEIAPHLPQRLDGWTVLDIGCNAGFYSFELAHRGARVTGIDHDPHYLEQARWAAGVLGVADRVSFRQQGVYELAGTAETFDLVLFMGVFYHLRYPVLGLDIVARLVRRQLVFQTLTTLDEEVAPPVADFGLDERDRVRAPGWPRLAYVEERLAGDPTNWWVPNHAAVLALLRSCSLRVVDRPGHEIYLCVPDPDACRLQPDEDEYRTATGRGRRTPG